MLTCLKFGVGFALFVSTLYTTTTTGVSSTYIYINSEWHLSTIFQVFHYNCFLQCFLKNNFLLCIFILSKFLETTHSARWERKRRHARTSTPRPDWCMQMSIDMNLLMLCNATKPPSIEYIDNLMNGNGSRITTQRDKQRERIRKNTQTVCRNNGRPQTASKTSSWSMVCVFLLIRFPTLKLTDL